MKTTLALAVLGTMIGGCASELDGATSEELIAVAELEGDVRFLDVASSSRPMERELADDSPFAAPVVVRVHGNVAVAWWAPYGEPIETPEGFVAFWDVEGRARDANGTDLTMYRSDELRGDGTVAPAMPPTGSTTPQPDQQDAPMFAAPAGLDETIIPAPTEMPIIDFPYVLVDWREVHVELEDLPMGYHRGC